MSSIVLTKDSSLGKTGETVSVSWVEGTRLIREGLAKEPGSESQNPQQISEPQPELIAETSQPVEVSEPESESEPEW